MWSQATGEGNLSIVIGKQKILFLKNVFDTVEWFQAKSKSDLFVAVLKWYLSCQDQLSFSI